jgi:hypothetical protein
MVIRFIAYINLIKRGHYVKQEVCKVNIVKQEAIEVLQTTLDEKDPVLLHAWDFYPLECHKIPLLALLG